MKFIELILLIISIWIGVWGFSEIIKNAVVKALKEYFGEKKDG